jgi:hypothetical protein
MTQPISAKRNLLNMRTVFISFIALILTISCKKETGSFLPKYAAIQGTWKTQSMIYDSSGVLVTKTLRYDRLAINQNLTYKIYYDSVNELENGIVRIVTQSNSELELFFEAHYPVYSSFAGSHIFAQSTVFLVNLTKDELVLRDVDNSYYSPREFHFIK